jgi:hypothetical protein
MNYEETDRPLTTDSAETTAYIDNYDEQLSFLGQRERVHRLVKNYDWVTLANRLNLPR